MTTGRSKFFSPQSNVSGNMARTAQVLKVVISIRYFKGKAKPNRYSVMNFHELMSSTANLTHTTGATLNTALYRIPSGPVCRCAITTLPIPVRFVLWSLCGLVFCRARRGAKEVGRVPEVGPWPRYELSALRTRLGALRLFTNTSKRAGLVALLRAELFRVGYESCEQCAAPLARPLNRPFVFFPSHVERYKKDLCELDADYFAAGKKRLEAHQAQPRMFAPDPSPIDQQLTTGL